ncbi:cystathionine beta-synthase-like protein isoform X1 [Frankliniella occidentalis]|uniref:Cystathionine beta-synthase n=1 Tax=Frankliniella occidentalis TaxID=133901 RepID=A0A6J1SQP8_FRAOC|nr:cystathionine beta-synthase-like protein isoform X1 [Frankliniella occidentalis]
MSPPTAPHQGGCPFAHRKDALDLSAVINDVINKKDSFDPRTELLRPDKIHSCTWALGADPSTSPHAKWEKPVYQEKILPNILTTIGNTPLVRLNKIPKAYGLKCEVVAKIEFLNPGGSIKDRIALRMVEDAERQGILKPGGVIIEATSGNTGVGLAMVAAVKGYKCIMVIQDKISMDKIRTIIAFGAEVVRVPTMVSFDSAEGIMGVSQRLHKLIPNSLLINQFMNPSNPLAHYDTTGQEIVDGCDGKVDMVVMGTGTGGTATGVSRKIKELCPNAKIIGADPLGSVMALPSSLNKIGVPVTVEGIGYVFIPTALDRSLIDEWIKVDDKDSLNMARRLIREEGLACGGSSGVLMAAAMKAAAHLKEGQRCVVLIPDTIRNYLTNFTNDSWMEARGYIESPLTKNLWWSSKLVSDLNLKAPTTIKLSDTCQKAFDMMNKEGVQQLAVVGKSGMLEGMLSMPDIMSSISKGTVKLSDSVENSVSRQFQTVLSDLTLDKVSKFLDLGEYVTVVSSVCVYTRTVIGIVTPADLLRFISIGEKQK